MLVKQFKIIFFIKILLLLSSIAALWILHINSSHEYKNNKNRMNNNIFFILDISHSMNVKDVEWNHWLKMSRLNLAKELIKKKTKLYEEKKKNIKFGLLLFSQSSNLFIPPTYDYKNLNRHLWNINTNYLPWWGSNITKAIQKFINSTTKGGKGILISDFWDNEDFQKQTKNIKELQKKIQKKNLSFITIGIGSQKWNNVTYPSWKTIYNNWKKVEDKLNTKYLDFISQKINAKKYVFQKLSQIKNINILENNSIKFTKDNKDKIIIEFLAGLFAILWL